MTTLPPPVCILTAGKGTRMGPLGGVLNKSLVPVRQRAILSHLLDAFPAGTEFVIGLGHMADQVRDYLALAHPDVSVQFVEIDQFEGPGSGPGYSLWCCREMLRRPFYFVPCDVLIEIPPTLPPGNWLGVAQVAEADSAAYCNILADAEGRVTEVVDKQPVDERFRAFTGLLYVRDYEDFWSALESAAPIAGERQVSSGVAALAARGELQAVNITWTDVGTQDKYRAVIEQDSGFDFSKSDECLYLTGNRVVKFFVDDKIVANRVAKARLRPAVFPAISAPGRQFYGYDFVPGKTLYAHNSPRIFSKLLHWLDEQVWTPVAVPEARMRELCRRFYHDKTIQRLTQFRKKYPAAVPPRRLNGETLPALSCVLEKVDWALLEQGVPTFMHGDLQFDNILHDAATDRFVLLDWRQDFAGEVGFGDLYYDLAKLMGGLILNYDYIKAGLFAVETDDGDMTVDFASRHLGATYMRLLEEFISRRGLNLSKVRQLVGLIYLNMAPLHHAPFDVALHALGTSILARETGGGVR